MKCDFVLTPPQKMLVENNLSVIEKTIRLYIRPNESVCGMGYSDLYQEGAVALCKAAATYHDDSAAQFGTYAIAVIRNHLYNYCNAVNTRMRKMPSVSLDEGFSGSGQPPPFLELSVPDGIDDLLVKLDTAALIADCKRRYCGVARLGVEALELKIKGFSGADIARLYRTTPNNVGAWISRAAQKIKKDMQSSVEKHMPRL